MPDHPGRLALLTDLYELTMMQGYHRSGMNGRAVFDLMIRRLPSNRGFLLAAGMEEAARYLVTVGFDDDAIAYLRSTDQFTGEFLDYLRQFRFSGDLWAVDDATPVFGGEMVLRVEAPLLEAQLAETMLLNIVHYCTLVATKSARCVLAAPNRMLMEFGLRRAHGTDAGMRAARYSYVAGFAGTSNVLAGKEYGIPVQGTMAHSYVLAHAEEKDAFLSFARAYPHGTVLLIDTYDTRRGAETVVEVARELAAEGIPVHGVRIDSGDLDRASREVRRIIDHGGLPEARIFASGNLDEYSLSELIADAAPIDGFGVGTRVITSEDVPYLECGYKLVEYEGRAVRKLSTGKETLPGRKQIFRVIDSDRRQVHDTIGFADEDLPGRPLLQRIVADGRRTTPAPSLDSLRDACRARLDELPASLRGLRGPHPNPVELSAGMARAVQTPGGGMGRRNAETEEGNEKVGESRSP